MLDDIVEEVTQPQIKSLRTDLFDDLRCPHRERWMVVKEPLKPTTVKTFD